MPEAPVANNERDRLSALRSYDVLDTPREAIYDDLTALAASIAQAPIALVSLVDEHRQWFKSVQGLDVCQTDRKVAFCAYTILDDKPLIVWDATKHPYFADNPLVTGPPHIRSYAGFPLVVPGGYRLGTLCIIDTRPKNFSPTQIDQLSRLARQVVSQLIKHVQYRQLQQASERLEKIATQLPGVVYQYQLRPDGSSCFPYASEGIRAIYELSPQEVQRDASAVIERLHPDDLDHVVQSIQDSAETLQHWRCEYRYRTTEGSYRWLLGQSVPQRTEDGGTLWHGFITDVTTARLTEQRLRLALDGAQLGLWDWNLRDGQVYFDPGWYRLLGYKPNDFEANFENWKKIVHPDDFACVQPELKKHFADPFYRYDVLLRHRTADGSWRWMNSVGEVVERDENGAPVRMVGIHRDVHEQQITLDQLTNARLAAETANQAKSAFLANMSHEIRTPMTAILGYTDLLAEPACTPEEHTTYTQTIKRNGEHLLSIINDILDFSRIEAGRIDLEQQPVDLCQMLQDVADMMRIRADEKNLSLFISRPEGRCVVSTDPTRLRQILVNLVGNAIKFTESGEVKLSLRRSAGTTPDRCNAVFTIADSGIGIAADKLPTLFTPFTQTDCSHTRRFGGTGLGLSISQRFAQLLGGRIKAESTPDVGSRFTLMLDDLQLISSEATADTKPAPSVKPKPGVNEPLRGLRILLAEDGPDNQRLISFHLRRAGAMVFTTDTGEGAVKLAMEAMSQGRPYDVILMDVQMPVMDGYTATHRLRDKGYPHRIVFLTAHATIGERNRAMVHGGDDFLTKPIDVEQLLLTCRGGRSDARAA